MPVFTRASRRYRFVPGYGGNLIVRQGDIYGQVIEGSEVTFDVAQYGIKRFYLNEETTHSGDVGGESYTQVGHAWRFRANVAFPAAGLLGAEEVLAAAFAEEILGSPRGFDAIFNVGDPEYWTQLGLDPRSYRGHARAEFIDVDSITKQTVKINVEGVGEGILLCQVGTPGEATTVAPLPEN